MHPQKESVSSTELEKLNVVKQIGEGGYAKVLLAATSEGTQYAVKMIPKSRNQQNNISRETRAGRNLTHPNIAKFIASTSDEYNDYLIFEYVQCPDLFAYLADHRNMRIFTEHEAKHIIRQVVETVKHIHSKGVVHLDLKLDNILINPRTHNVKLIDFGLCDFISPECDKIYRRVGSEEYCAPEIMSAKSDWFVGSKLDVWCIGVILYTMVVAQFPFDVELRKEIVRAGKPHPKVNLDAFSASRQCKELIAGMLETDPAKRFSIAQVLEHPWFQTVPDGSC